jgi:hypothetical protein
VLRLSQDPWMVDVLVFDLDLDVVAASAQLTADRR